MDATAVGCRRAAVKGAQRCWAELHRSHKHLISEHNPNSWECLIFLFFHFSDSRYQAAFISICLDTIYDQLFRLVFFLFFGFWSFQAAAVGACAPWLESVCRPPPQHARSSAASAKGEVCLFCHFVAPPLTCVGVFVAAVFCFVFPGGWARSGSAMQTDLTAV